MVASSVTVGTPSTLPNYIDQPSIVVRWTGGVGPFDVEYTWDDDPTFANGNGNQQTSTNTSVTSVDFEAPPAALADVSDGTTWYLRANVIDQGDAGAALADTDQFVYFATNPLDRSHLYLLANVGVAFHPTDEPAGGWGTGIGGTEGADGENNPKVRSHLYLMGNVGVGFTPTDDPVGGWNEGIGGTVGPDGDTRDDFNRYLYLLANVDGTQPCPFIYRLSSTTVEQGASLTIYGQGLVSATNPTADAWGAEVRLYDTPDLMGSFTVLTITDWSAGETEDSITVTVPANATSGFVAVVHTTTPSCAGSNFFGLTVISLQPDADAGWWVEVWDLRNSTKIISFVPDVADGVTEHIPGDIGRGHIRMPQEHPDILDIVDRTASPQQQRLVKIYQHARFAYAFIPDDVEDEYSEDGAALSRIYGKGQERILQWGRCLWKDFPTNPTSTRTWLYGSEENLLPWLNGEEDSLVTNGGFEEASLNGWNIVGTATAGALSTAQHSGSWAARIVPAALNDGLETDPFTVEEGAAVFADAWVRDEGPTFDKTIRVELVDDEDTVLAGANVQPATAAWIPVNLGSNGQLTAGHRIVVKQTAGTLGPFWFDDAAAYSGISGTHDTGPGVSLDLSRTNVLEGLHSIQATMPNDKNGVTLYANVQPNQDYTFTLKMVGTSGKTVAAQMILGPTAPNDQITLTGGTDILTISGTAGPTTTVAKIFFRSDEAAGDVFYIDDSSLIPGQPAANPGQIVLDVLAAMQARGTLDFVTTTFDGSFDSAGIPWPETLPFEVDPQWTLYDLLDKLQGLGYRMGFWPIGWRGGGDTGWELALYGPGNAGTKWQDVEEGPALLPSTTIEEVDASSAPPLETVVYGEGAAGLWAVASLSASELTSLERREGFINNPAATAQTTVFRAASHRLTTSSTRGASFTASLTDAGDPLPYFHFLPLDVLRAHLPSNHSRDHVADAAYKTSAVTTMFGSSGRTLRYQIDMGSYKLHAQRIRDLLLSRMVEREASENYLPGTGSVSSTRGGGGGGTQPATATLQEGIVALHDHLWADLEPDNLGGDLAGTMPSPQVQGLRGRKIGAAAPTDGQVYKWDDGAQLWVPGGAFTYGEATIADSASTQVVAHNLGGTPTAVLVTSQGNELVWVTSVGASNFTLNRSGSTGALDVYWQAIE